MRLALLLLALIPVIYAAGSNWAILVAGSNGYYNYRHQSDISHSYQILTKKGGFKPENIVTMMYDDIANNAQNPVKGNLINKPNGPNVYEGVKIDYVGAQVTADNFFFALTCQGTATTKCIKPASTDNVFIYYSDHGAPGYVAMPTGNGIYADKLIATVRDMSAKQKFAKIVLYIEACESGSMCNKLTAADKNIYCTTASTPDQSSYAYYYDNLRKTYLGDEYSIHWMEDSDDADFTKETLEQQYANVANLTKESQVQHYGDIAGMGAIPLIQFQGFEKHVSRRNMMSGPAYTATPKDRVNIRDVRLAHYWMSAQEAKTPEEFDAAIKLYQAEQELRGAIKGTFERFLDKLTGSAEKRAELMNGKTEVRDFDCYRAAVSALNEHCFHIDSHEYAMGFMYSLSNACNAGYTIFAPAAKAVCKGLKLF